MERRIVNPIYKDEVLFLETSAETGGVYSRFEVTLAAGGANPPHFHSAFTEKFTALKGVLGLQLKSGNKYLNPGESYTVAKKEVHNFFNPIKEDIVFEIIFKPGHEGMENCLRIAYGLAGDGQTNKKGMPKNIYAAALIMDMSNSYPTGFLAVIRPLFSWLAKKARKKGIEKKLIEKYGGRIEAAIPVVS